MNAKDFQNKYERIKTKYSEHLLLFRRGYNFIALREDANIVAKVCRIQKTNTIIKFGYDKLPFYLPKLVRSGHKTVICEEL